MPNKCKICRVPLEGFGYKIAHFLFHVEPSKKKGKQGICNKCENKSEAKKR